jgi:hypothetical protein
LISCRLFIRLWPGDALEGELQFVPRHSVSVAIATLDEISGGRAVLGLGAGVSEFAELGIQPHRPPRAIREAIALIRTLLRGEQARVETRNSATVIGSSLAALMAPTSARTGAAVQAPCAAQPLA